MRRTRQGEVILEELRKLKTHPRTDELYALVRERLPRVSLGTVYRNLDRLQRDGLATEIYCGDFVRYDGNVTPHDHFLCRRCQRVWDVPATGVPPATEPRLNGDPGQFLIEGSYTMHYGLCAECANSSSAS